MLAAQEITHHNSTCMLREHYHVHALTNTYTHTCGCAGTQTICLYMHKYACINLHTKQNKKKKIWKYTSRLSVQSMQSHARSCSLWCGDSKLYVSFLPRKREWTRGNTLTGSPGVLARVRSARGSEWLWEAVPPLSSLSTDYEAGPRRVPLGTPQATHSLLLLCYRICRWGIWLKCEEGCV